MGKLNLGFTKVTSPMDGQVSRFYLTVGNLVNQDQTVLTTVVSLEPMYGYVLDDQNKVQYRRVTTGALEDDGLRVISNGLKPDD